MSDVEMLTQLVKSAIRLFSAPQRPAAELYHTLTSGSIGRGPAGSDYLPLPETLLNGAHHFRTFGHVAKDHQRS
jgi:hypothetical protein